MILGPIFVCLILFSINGFRPPITEPQKFERPNCIDDEYKTVHHCRNNVSLVKVQGNRHSYHFSRRIHYELGSRCTMLKSSRRCRSYRDVNYSTTHNSLVRSCLYTLFFNLLLSVSQSLDRFFSISVDLVLSGTVHHYFQVQEYV